MVWLLLAGVIGACHREAVSLVSPEVSGTPALIGARPLVVVDGVVITGKFKNPDKFDIASVTVRRSDDALIKEFGAGAKEGVLFISTRRK